VGVCYKKSNVLLRVFARNDFQRQRSSSDPPFRLLSKISVNPAVKKSVRFRDFVDILRSGPMRLGGSVEDLRSSDHFASVALEVCRRCRCRHGRRCSSEYC